MNSLLSTNKIDAENSLEEILGLGEMSETEKRDFLNNVGKLVIESAVLKFVVSIPPEERIAFEEWLEAHGNEDDLFESSLKTYPLFADILQTEADAFYSEAKRLFGVIK